VRQAQPVGGFLLRFAEPAPDVASDDDGHDHIVERVEDRDDLGVEFDRAGRTGR
jgi:hypothetical protein